MEQKAPDEVCASARVALNSGEAWRRKVGSIVARRFWSQLATRNLPAYWATGTPTARDLGRNDFIATEADHPFIAGLSTRRGPEGRVSRARSSTMAFGRPYPSRTVSPAGKRRAANSIREYHALREWIEKVRKGQ